MINFDNIFSCEFFGFGKKKNEPEKPSKLAKPSYEPGTIDENDIKEIFKIVKEVLQKHKNIKGFEIESDPDQIKEFIDDESSELFLVHCDAWAFYKPKSAREQMSIDGLQEYCNEINSVGKEISDKVVPKYGGKVEWDGGDWDETFISYYK